MKKQTQAIIASILLMISIPAFSEEGDFYFGLGIGQSQFKLNEPTLINSYLLSNNSTFSDTSTAISFYSGIKLDEYLSLEADIVLTGDITATSNLQTTKLFNVSGLSLTAMLSTQLSERVTLFGRMGAIFWDISESSDNLTTINNAVDITYGGGLDINLYGSADRQLRLQWNHYEYDGVFINSSDAFTASLLFLFDFD